MTAAFGSGTLFSSAAAADQSHLTTLGIVQSTGANFDGIGTSTNDVLVKFTYFGDANLDGKVDGSDYALADNGFDKHLTGWANGDFNYDASRRRQRLHVDR